MTLSKAKPVLRALLVTAAVAMSVGACTARVSMPQFDPDGGYIGGRIEVKITCLTKDATIRWTKGDREVTDRSLEYTKPIVLDRPDILRARAYKDDDESEEARAEFKLEIQKIKTPELDPPKVTFKERVFVGADCETKGVTYRYTIDGPDPTERSDVFPGGMAIEETCMLKVRAFRDGWVPSDTVIGNYTKEKVLVERCEFEPRAETKIDHELRVKITCRTPDVVIRYTMNGDEPTKNSRVYKEPLVLNKESTIVARAFAEDGTAGQAERAHYPNRFPEVAAPDIEPDDCGFKDKLRIKMSCGTPGAKVFYTLDGKEPTPRSIEYKGPFEITESCTILVQGYREGSRDSPVSEAEFERTVEQVATPTCEPRAGTKFKGMELVTLQCATKGAKIYYTRDGTEPGQRSEEYRNPITMTKNTTIRARAYLDRWAPSDIMEADFIRTVEKVATPKFETRPGRYEEEVAVKITCATPGAVIRYTVDYKTPTENSAIYKEPIKSMDTIDLKVMAFKPEFTPSDMAEGRYEVTWPTCDTPKFKPTDKYFSDEVTVEITCGTDKSVIRYTTDGSDPRESSDLYKGPFKLTDTTTVKARAFREKWTTSKLAEMRYEEKNGRCEKPEVEPSSREFDKNIEIRMKCDTPGAKIYYNINSKDKPSERSEEYERPFKLEETCILKAIAIKPEWADSEIVDRAYTLKMYPCKDPEFEPESKEFTDKLVVKITCDTDKAKIYYTLNGNPPSERDELYDGPITLTKSTTIKARAFKEKWLPSKEITEKYTKK